MRLDYEKYELKNKTNALKRTPDGDTKSEFLLIYSDSRYIRRFVDAKEHCSATEGISGVDIDQKQQEDACEYLNDLIDRNDKRSRNKGI